MPHFGHAILNECECLDLSPRCLNAKLMREASPPRLAHILAVHVSGKELARPCFPRLDKTEIGRYFERLTAHTRLWSSFRAPAARLRTEAESILVSRSSRRFRPARQSTAPRTGPRLARGLARLSAVSYREVVRCTPGRSLLLTISRARSRSALPLGNDPLGLSKGLDRPALTIFSCVGRDL